MRNSTKILIGILIASLAVLIVLVVSRAHMNKQLGSIGGDQATLPQQTSPATGFAWKYEAGGEDLDGLPKTRVSLEAVYENGKVVLQRVDEVQGSCNAIDPQENTEDMVAGTQFIQCYAAGFGQWYKMVKGETSYDVMRKYFVEATPEQTPPEYQYEKVASVPLFQ